MNSSKSTSLRRVGRIWHNDAADESPLQPPNVPRAISATASTKTSSSESYSGYIYFARHELLNESSIDQASIDSITSSIEHRWSHQLNDEDRKKWDHYAEKKRKSTPTIRVSSKEPVQSEACTENSRSDISPVETAVNKTIRKTITDDDGSSEIVSSQERKKDATHDEEPRKPMKPRTAYIYFAKEMRPIIKERYPSLPGVTVTKELGTMWNQMSVMAKYKYRAKEEQAKRDYAIALEQWKNNRSDKSQFCVSECSSVCDSSVGMNTPSMASLIGGDATSVDVSYDNLLTHSSIPSSDSHVPHLNFAATSQVFRPTRDYFRLDGKQEYTGSQFQQFR